MVRYETLRQRLIARRKDLGLTQRAVAARMGIDNAVLSLLENGKNPNPTTNLLATWCRVLGGSLNVDVVFEGEEKGMPCGLDPDSPADACSCADACLKQQLAEATR
jgi:transcriptional regulator with XRE-family HTH domain